MSCVVADWRLNELCRPGRGAETCRYLGGGAMGFECLKHQEGFRQEIDRRSAEGTMVARGNNCHGIWGADDVCNI